jgi:hypothetical protein
MPRSQLTVSKRARNTTSKKSKAKSDAGEPRYTVGLPSALARRVERYAGTVDASMSKAIATLVRLGLESQEERKREFFKKLKANLADDDPAHQDQMVDEFRALILGQ